MTCKRPHCPKSVPDDAFYCGPLCERIHRVSLLLATAQSPEAGKEALAAAHLVLRNMQKYELVFYVRDPQHRASLALGVERYHAATSAERDRRAAGLLEASKGAVLLTQAEAAIADTNAQRKAARQDPPERDATAPRGIGSFFTFGNLVAAGATLLGAAVLEDGRTVADVVTQVTGSARAIRADIDALMDELGLQDDDEDAAPTQQRAKPRKPRRAKAAATKRKPAKKKR